MYKISIILPNEPWKGNNGVCRVVEKISDLLINNFHIDIHCIGKKDDLYYYKNIPIHVYKGYNKDLSLSPSLFKNIKKNIDCDLIHYHNYSSFIPLISLVFKKNKKLIFSPYFHQLGSKSIYSLIRMAYDPILGKYLFSIPDIISCFSYTEKKILLSKFSIPYEKIKVIYLGANLEEINNSKPYEVDDKIILYVGRIEKYKNIQLIIKSLIYLPDEYKLYIIGKGNYKTYLEKIVFELGLKNRVKFFGYLSDDEMFKWIKTCYVFVQLSDIESGISLSCIDALAAKKPIIVNDNFFSLGETVKLIQGEGVIPFSKKNQDLKDLADLIKNSNNIKVNANLSDFNWNITAKKYKNIYSNIF